MTSKVSIIVRTKNEERWIGQCLSAIVQQTYKNIEIILVDNVSTDKTIEVASNYDLKIVNYSPDFGFKPGKSINLGIEASDGDIIVIISGHCIPTNEKWLECLIKDVKSDCVAGIYGRQEPLSFTSSLDKRDLAITFGLDKKIQHKDPFFHNANSCLTRAIWEKFPFDEDCTNIEDRIWGQKVIKEGYKIVYEPDASVFHHHGIHHGSDERRANNIVRIMDTMADKKIKKSKVSSLNIAAFIPIRGDLISYGDKYLLKNTITQLKGIDLINDIVISTDSQKTADIAKKLGASRIISRPSQLSKKYVGVADVIKFTLEEYEKHYQNLDLIVFMEETYPFRNKDEIRDMIETLIEQGNDSLIAVKNEQKGVWERADNTVKPIIEQTFMPRVLKSSSIDIAQIGYCTLLSPQHVRFGDILGPDTGLFRLNNNLNTVEIRDAHDMSLYVDILSKF